MENVATTVSNGSIQEFKLIEYNYYNSPVLAGILATHEVIAVKPICENLGLDYTWQWRKIQNDEILNQLLLKEKVLTGGKYREMVCFDFGGVQEWLWSIKPTENTNIELLEAYKKGLVLFLVNALGMSLAKIAALKTESDHWKTQFEGLAQDAQMMIEADQEGKNYTKDAKNSFSKANQLRKQILDRLASQQLSLF